MMSIYKNVKKFIDKKENNEIFTAKDIKLGLSTNKQVSNALSRLAKENYIERLSRGKYYKPKKTKFGNVKPSDDVIIKKVINDLYKKTKTKPYLASNSVYQKLGLTTQVSPEIFLVCNTKVSYNFVIKNLKFNLIKYEGKWNKKDIKYFEFFYALQNIKKIPDSDVNEVYNKLLHRLSDYNSSNDIIGLIKVMEYFNNTTKALLGSMFEQLGFKIGMKKIKKELNPKTNYYIKINNNIIPKSIKTNWRIYDPT
jgi:hypothetical protein